MAGSLTAFVPNLPKRPCSYPGGCPALVEPGTAGGRCPKHQKREFNELDGPRLKTAERGYGGTHRKLRVLCFERDRWRCVDCGWEPDSVRIYREAGFPELPSTDGVLAELRRAFALGSRHLHADHEIPIEVRPDLQHDLGNYRTRCDLCHNAKTAREDGGFGNRQAQGGRVGPISGESAR